MSNGIQHKMLTYEVTPPPGVWNKIVAGLGEPETKPVFPTILYEAEIIPPISTWNKIQISLNAEHGASVTKHRRISPVFRYAAAAAVTGLIAWGGFLLLNNKKSPDKRIANTELSPAVRDNIKSANDQSPEKSIENITAAISTIDADEARNDAALEASKKTFAKLEVPANKSRLKNIASSFRFSFEGDSDNAQTSNSSEECPPDFSTRYITMMTREGNIIRVSKKLGDLACCVSGEDDNKDCKYQMSRWREKFACSPTGHSTGSFLDILSLVNSLQDQ